MKQVSMIMRLAANDFKSRYASSLLGVLWAFVQPVVTILVFWFVFQMGFKNPPIENMPYILWFIAAYVPWIYFNDMISFGVNSLADYSYLVKKVKFKVEYLPLIRIISSLFVHIFFIFFIFFMFFCYSYPVSVFSVQAVYYSFSLTVFSGGLVLLLSAFSVFFRDIAQIVMIILQVGFWATPIFWNVADIEEIWVLKIIKLNPLYYIIEGYRESFVYNIPFWKHPVQTVYFWAITIIVCLMGGFTFNRLRSHFADEL